MRSFRNIRKLNEEIGISKDDVKAAFEKAGIKVRVADISHQFGDGYFEIDVVKPINLSSVMLELKNSITGDVTLELRCSLGHTSDDYDTNREDEVIEFLKRFKKTRAILEDLVGSLGDAEFKHRDI